MNFLLDVNVGESVARWLNDAGHDIAEVGWKDSKMSDSNILQWAVSENRIIVTTDNDFEEMIWCQGKRHCGILRLENLPRAERMLLLRDALERHGKDLSDGAIVIASSTEFRVRNPLQSEKSK